MLLINLAVGFLNALKVKSLECMSMINQKSITTPKIINTNDDEPVFYPYSIKINKCSGSIKILMILLRDYAFLMLVRILMLRCFTYWRE